MRHHLQQICRKGSMFSPNIYKTQPLPKKAAHCVVSRVHLSAEPSRQLQTYGFVESHNFPWRSALRCQEKCSLKQRCLDSISLQSTDEATQRNQRTQSNVTKLKTGLFSSCFYSTLTDCYSALKQTYAALSLLRQHMIGEYIPLANVRATELPPSAVNLT
ncbi:hypothetical protein T10_4065 [Trichinella papuae]|uniref:Uncharacterized protein n=1 Tax=Trichinella papuae TaxID=268474 RepID=A0A0V1MBX0_9BILA|nr:hypothetical protein T10_4065 [Trichinella papuae]